MAMKHNSVILKYVLIAVLISSQAQEVIAQLNMKAGFTSLYTPAVELNNIIDDFNNRADDPLQTPIPELHFLNGMQVGLRYSLDFIMLDFTWENTLRKRLGFGESSAGALIEKEYFFNFNSLSLNLETRINPNFHLSLGAGRRTFRIRREIGTSDRKINIFDEPAHQYFLQVKPIFVISPYARTPLAISPFFLYPLDQINLSNFEEDLFEIEEASTARVGDFLSVGISVTYYYGGGIN